MTIIVAFILGGQNYFLLTVPDGELILNAVIVDLVNLGYNIAVQVIRAARNVAIQSQASDLSVLIAAGLLGQCRSLGNVGCGVPVVTDLPVLTETSPLSLVTNTTASSAMRKFLEESAGEAVNLPSSMEPD